MPTDQLMSCPFCDGCAEIERRGTARVGCMVICTDCGASHESGDTCNSGQSWNTRATTKREEELREALEKIFKVSYDSRYYDLLLTKCGLIAEEALQQTEEDKQDG